MELKYVMEVLLEITVPVVQVVLVRMVATIITQQVPPDNQEQYLYLNIVHKNLQRTNKYQ